MRFTRGKQGFFALQRQSDKGYLSLNPAWCHACDDTHACGLTSALHTGNDIACDAGVQLILGLNGVIWVSAEVQKALEQDSGGLLSDAQPVTVRDVLPAERQAIARVANCIRALAKLYFSIHPASILSVYTVCNTQCMHVSTVINAEQLFLFCTSAPHASLDWTACFESAQS